MEDKPYLQKLIYQKNKVENETAYPFGVGAIKNLDSLEFNESVTFFVGENGSGKSTLLEAIALLLNINPEGGNKNTTFYTNNTHSELNKYLKAIKGSNYPKDWYFLRAESFYNVASFMEDKPEYLASYGGKSLHEQSHGESFLSTLVNKLKGNGLYLFDEPEAALSPLRQMAILPVIHELVKKKSQLIIATHSPILLSYPNSKIYHFSQKGIYPIKYEDTEHYKVTKDFLNQYEKMLKILLEN